MAQKDVRTLAEKRVSYVEKNAYLMDMLGDSVPCRDFYRDIFPSGFLQDAYRANPGAPHDGKYVAIANAIHERRKDGKPYRRNHYVTDDLGMLARLSHLVAFVSPCSYLGGAKDLEHLRYIHAFVVDLDYVDVPQLNDLVHQSLIGYIPTPTYIVNSGTGLHLYYVLEEPLICWPNQQNAYSALKHALIGLVWNEYTSQSIERQYSGIVQPYRIVGSRSKLDCDESTERVVSQDYPVLAWKWGEKWTADALASFKPSIDAGLKWWDEGIERYNALLHPEADPDHLTREKAKALYPEWYHERVELGMPAKPVTKWKWHTSRAVYDAWLRRIRVEAVPGHRYHCIMMLAVYALKCDIPYPELKEDAYGLLEEFEARTDDETNHFKRSDIAQALRAYHRKGYITLPIASISYFSGLRIEPNRRNGRKQDVHLGRARAVQRFDDPDGSWRNKDGRPKGSGTKRDMILAYAAEHPEANHSQIAKALGVSRPTVIKWLKSC